jgi:RND superfamily putative drug exporter
MFVFNDFLGHVLHEILSTDVITTVVALLTILLFVGSVPLMVLPIANLIASMVLSMALLYSLTHAWAIATFVPGVVMSLILAITIDYSFFILVRYNREVTEFPEEHYRAVVRTVSFAGQVISISGVTLAVSFLGLVFLGVGFMNGIGIGCFLSLLIMILANLTLGPSLLLAFPAFFARRLCWTCKRREMVDSIWYKLASFATSTKGAVILLGGTAVLIAPVIAGCAWFETVHDMSLAFVKSLPSVSALDCIQRHFPPGMIMPIYATAEMGPAQDPFCQEYFDESQELIHRLTDATGGGISNSSVISMSVVDGYFLPFQVAQLMLEVPEYQYLLKRVRSIADDGAAATMILYTTFSPISPLFYDFNTKIRDVMTDFRKTARFDWTLGGLEILVRDLSDRSYARFPVMLSVTLLIVGVFVGVTMRSVLLPIRLVFTIGLTVAWTYGLASLIFCAGILDWISPAINNNQHDMYWLVPLTMTTIVIGLGCDYDIFLFTRITELRAEGKSPDEAICEGYYHTGEVITGAGLVMAIAFSGLASSEMPIVREIGTFLAGSVILDTFVVRMLIVPPILHFLGRFNWWPSRLSLKADYAPLH